MCGILGYYGKLNDIDFENCLKNLNHRGPDDQGYNVFSINNNILKLGQTRLSIIDLTKLGHQPMTSNCENYTIVFNGEIYNYIEIRNELIELGYIFKTNSDTEVLLNSWICWGNKSLNKLIGMFSFVIYDKNLNKLFCVRDQFGIKPFYYSVQDNNFYFSSEIPTLLKLIPKENKLNFNSVHRYLVNGEYDNTQETFYDCIFQLMPSNYLVIDLNSKLLENSTYQWWDPSIQVNPTIKYANASATLKNIFLESINLHCRSDVPVAAALSGGLDSSSIVFALRHLFPDLEIHTFSFISSDSKNNEEIWIDYVNKSAKAIEHKIKISSEDFLSDIRDIIKCQGEPFMSTSIYAQYRIFKEANKYGIKVILDGQGADEILAGYNGYPVSKIKSMLHNFQYHKIYKFVFNWHKWPGRSSLQSFKNLISAIIPEKIKNRLNHKKSNWINYNNLLIEDLSNFNTIKYDKSRSLIFTLKNEILHGGLLRLLRHEDRNSMFFSIESRVPFLNKKLVEYLFTLPESFLISDEGRTKHIFRDSMKNIVPKNILERKDKIGFITPEEIWIKKQKIEIIQILSIAKNLNFLNYNKIIEDFNLYFDNKIQYNNKFWRVINFCIWYEIFFDNKSQ